jgi:beta-glucanase (GH16 family)
MYKVLLSSVVVEAIAKKHLRVVEDEIGGGVKAAGFSDNFKNYKPQLWDQVTGVEHCNDGACVDNRIDHLKYSTSGLQITMDQKGSTNKDKWSSGHIITVGSFNVGSSLSASVRIAHSPTGGATPTNAFTCIGCYAYGAAAHNEISYCIEGTDQTQLGAAYWYDKTEHKTMIHAGADLSLDFHTYGFNWTSTAINWYLDNKLVHTSKGSAATLPSEGMQCGLILRPRSAPYLGDAILTSNEFTMN